MIKLQSVKYIFKFYFFRDKNRDLNSVTIFPFFISFEIDVILQGLRLAVYAKFSLCYLCSAAYFQNFYVYLHENKTKLLFTMLHKFKI